MAVCGHCGKEVKGIRDHIRDKHGFPYYCQSPDFSCYFGKSDPPDKQVNDWPDETFKEYF